MDKTAAQLSHTPLLLITGKGGVGRTTLSAAISRHLGQLPLSKNSATHARRNILLVDASETLDNNSSPLAQLFNHQRFPSERPAKLGPSLSAIHVSSSQGHHAFLQSTFSMGGLAVAALRSKALQSFLNTAPSLTELGCFYHLYDICKQAEKNGKPFDHIVVDMPATGHTLALTGLPKIVISLLPYGPISKLLKKLQVTLEDNTLCATWIATLAEQMPMQEALELSQKLAAQHIAIAGYLINQIPKHSLTPQEQEHILNNSISKNTFGIETLKKIRYQREHLKLFFKRVPQPQLHFHQHDTKNKSLALCEELNFLRTL